MSLFIEVPLALQDRICNKGGQCDCDCDCACPNLQPMPKTDVPSTQLHYQKTAQTVVKIPLSNEYHLFFNPNGGAPTVLNEAAYAIWDNLGTPVSFQELKERTNIQEARLYELISSLNRAQLLKTADEIPRNLESTRSNTLTAWLHVANDCHLACTYCYIDKSNERMDLNTGIKSLDVIFRQTAQHHYRSVKLKYSGGEPTLNFPLIKDLHNAALQKANLADFGLQEIILTNGIYWNSEMIDFVRQEHLDVMLSWDGLGTTHDGHRRTPSGSMTSALVKQTLERMLDTGLTPEVSITISAQNLDGLVSQVQWLLERKVRFSLNFYRAGSFIDNNLLLSNPEKVVAVLKQVYQRIEHYLPSYSLLSGLLDRTNLSHPHSHICSVGNDYLVIDHRGQISKCQMEMALKLTDLNDPDPLGTLRASQKGVQNPSVDNKQECSQCTWRYWCGGGCPLEAKNIFGRYDAVSAHCEIYRKLLPELLRLEGIRLLKYWNAEIRLQTPS